MSMHGNSILRGWLLAEWVNADNLSSVAGTHDGRKELPCVLYIHNSNSTIRVIMKPKCKVSKTGNMKLRITEDALA